jgi:hypothetical protein
MGFQTSDPHIHAISWFDEHTADAFNISIFVQTLRPSSSLTLKRLLMQILVYTPAVPSRPKTASLSARLPIRFKNKKIERHRDVSKETGSCSLYKPRLDDAGRRLLLCPAPRVAIKRYADEDTIIALASCSSKSSWVGPLASLR